MTDPIVFIVDDEPDVLEMLSGLLELVPLKTRTFTTGAAFLEAYEPGTPGCLVTDIRMPGMTGPELQESLAKRSDRLPVIVMSGFADVATTVRVMKAGAHDLIEKTTSPQALVQAIREAVEQDARNRAQDAVHATVRGRLDTLTPREWDVLNLLVTGKSSKVIAADLKISVNTVEVHRARIMKKMHAESSVELVRMCLEASPAPLGRSA